MSWLAKIRVDFATAATLRLSDNYAWHRAAWGAFPGRDGEPRQFLSRLDIHAGGFDLLLLSPEPLARPSWCPEDYYAAKKVASGFLEHRYYQFDLRANPSRKVTKLDREGKPTKNGRRLALLRAEDQLDWLLRKANGSGFRLLGSPPVHIDPAVPHLFRIPKMNSSGLHLGVNFRGLLEVTHREQFREAFHRGIGSAKAFGFGMLLLKPVHLS